MPDNKLKQFHESIKGNPNISGVPSDFNDFQSALRDSNKSKAFYDAISKNEAISGIPKDYNTFASSLGLVEKKNPNERPLVSSGPASSTESGKFVVPIQQGQSFVQKPVTEQLKTEEPKFDKPKEEDSGLQLWERSKSTMSALGRGVVNGVFATSLESIAIMSKKIDDELRDLGVSDPTKSIKDYQTYKWAKSIEGTMNETLPSNPKFKGEIQEDVASTAGDLLGLVATSIITKNPSSALAKLGYKGIVKGLATPATRKMIAMEIAKDGVKMLSKPATFVAASQTGARNYDEALAKGATEEQADAMYWSTAVSGGITNSLPVGQLLSRFDKASGGKLKQVVVGGTVGGIEEAVTEGVEQVVNNFAAKNIYDETRNLFEGLGENATMGGGIGFVLNAMGVKLGQVRNKYKNDPVKLAEVDKSIEYIKDKSESEGRLSAVKLNKEEQVKVDKYNKILEDPEVSNEIKDIAKDNIRKITGSKIVEAESTQERLDKLPEDSQIEVKLLDAEIERTKNAAQESNVVDIKDELESQLNDLNSHREAILNSGNLLAEPEVVSEPQTQEIATTPVSDAELANNILDQEQPSVEEIPTEQPLSEREQQMVTTPTEVPLEVTKVGKVLNKIGKFIGEGKENAILKGIDKMLSTGDLNAVRAKEIVDAETGNTIDKIKSISTKIQDLVGKDKVSRELANTVMSVDRLDDKISKLAVNDNYTAISDILDGKYTPEQIKSAMTYFKDNETPGTSIMTKEVFDNIVNDVSGIGAQKIADKKSESSSKVKSLVGKILNYDTVGKSQENVAVEPVLIQGSQSPMLTGSEISTGNISPESRTKNIETISDGPVSLVDLRAELASLPNGQKILQTLDESIANKKIAEEQLSKTAKGQKILDQAKEARNLIDSFTDWVSSSKSAAKIEQRVGEVIAGNRGSYLKRSFKYWKDKKFEPSEAMKNVALESVTEDLMVLELTQLSKSPEYNRLEGDAKRQYLTQITEDVRRRAKITLGTYLDEIRQKRKDGNSFFPNTKSEKVNGKTIEFRKLIDESFLDLLGNINDPISQFHDTVLAQTQIKAAANFHWIINEVTGKENIFDSREQVVEFNGISEGFKQINDPNSVLDGKWVNENIYDVISSSVPTKDGTLYHWFRVMLSTMRKTKTIYNFFAGWTTNLIGGELTLAANGVIPNPKKTGKYLLNRLKYVKNPEKLTADIQKDIDAMKDNGFWSTSVSAGTIKLLDDNYMDMTAYDRGEHVTKSATRRWIDKAKRIDDNVVRNYSVIDDFTKLIFFREKKDIFSRKLYGKKYDELTASEKNVVHANIAERGKQNIATMSRLPRIYSKIAKYPLGDFMAFRISAIKSGLNTFENAYRDINSSFDKTLSPEQQKAYLEDGLKTVSGMLMAAAANSALYGTLATLAMGVMDDEEKDKVRGVFKNKISDGVNYGSKSSLYTDFKGTPAVNPQWMRGKNNIPIKDDGNGNIEVLNISNKDPYDELFGMFLPRAGTTKEETYLGILKETFSPNMTVNLLTNIAKGEDQWGRDIYTGDDTRAQIVAKVGAYILTESLVPPAIKNVSKESYKQIQQSKAVEGDTKKDVNKKGVEPGEYFNALLNNSTMLLNRTYKVNLAEQFGYYTKEFFEARPEKFNDLDQDGKEKRFRDLERIRDGYNYLRRYSVLNNNSDFLDKATEQMFKSARGITENEKDYIVYGDKSYE